MDRRKPGGTDGDAKDIDELLRAPNLLSGHGGFKL